MKRLSFESLFYRTPSLLGDIYFKFVIFFREILMNRVLSTVLLFALALYGNMALASDAEFFRDTMDFKTVSITNPSQVNTISLSKSSPYDVRLNRVKVGTGSALAVRVTNTTDQAETEYLSITNGVLSCVSDCDSDAQSCYIDFSSSSSEYPASGSVPANGRWTPGIGGTLTVPANCGSGVFVGTAVWQGTGLVEKNLTFNIRVYLNVPVPTVVVSKMQDMNFGQVSSNQSHNVTLNPNGCTISSTDPAGIISTSGVQCGIFSIANPGTSAQALTNVTLPSSITLDKSSGGSSMALDITSYPDVSTITTIAAGSTTNVNVGGTLHVLSTNTAGTYSGNYTITVNY